MAVDVVADRRGVLEHLFADRNERGELLELRRRVVEAELRAGLVGSLVGGRVGRSVARRRLHVADHAARRGVLAEQVGKRQPLLPQAGILQRSRNDLLRDGVGVAARGLETGSPAAP